jgi:hypothetical protein
VCHFFDSVRHGFGRDPFGYNLHLRNITHSSNQPGYEAIVYDRLSNGLWYARRVWLVTANDEHFLPEDAYVITSSKTTPVVISRTSAHFGEPISGTLHFFPEHF